MNDLLVEIAGRPTAERRESDMRKARAESDFQYFCNTYLSHYFTKSPAPYQLAIYKVITEGRVDAEAAMELRRWTREPYRKYVRATEGLRGIIDMEPRDHGKSVRMTLAYPLWCALYAKRRFIALFGATDDDAKGFLENIKHEVDDNELIAKDFGEMRGSQWGAGKIVLANGVALIGKGKGASARGLRHHESRPDLVVIDDLLKDAEADSPDQCAKAYGWIKRTAFNLGKDSFIVMVNTHFNDHDPITMLQDEVLTGKLQGFLALRFSAQLEDGTPLWESRWTHADLERKRADVGELVYDVEYLSLSVNSEGRIFDPSWFQYFDIKDIDFTKMKVIMGVDPNAEGSDDAAIAVTAHDLVRKMKYVLAWWSKPYGTHMDLFDQLVLMYEMWNPEAIYFEEVAFQKFYKQFLLEKAMDLGIMLPLAGAKPGGSSKKKRCMQYQPHVQAGIIRFNETLRPTDEMSRLQAFPTKGVNDGIPDAVYYSVIPAAGPATPVGAAAQKKANRMKEMMRRYMYGR